MKLTHLIFAALVLCSSGCMFAEGGIREAFDHGDNARYENKGYWGHVADAAFEDDDECESTTVVIVRNR